MENTIPTGEELFKEAFNTDNCHIDYDKAGLKTIKKAMIKFAKLHVEAALKKASEDVIETIGDVEIKRRGIDKIILESYPLTNIK